MKQQTAFLCLTLFVFLAGCAVPPLYSKVYINNFTGPKNLTVKAFGNFDLNQTYWTQDVEEYSQTKQIILNLANYYIPSKLQSGFTYFLEYYRDSSLRTIAYILFQVNGTSAIKYYALKVQYNDVIYYLGSEQTSNIRAGRQMQLSNYTYLVPSASSSLLQSASISRRKTFNASKVLQLKFWSFPEAKLYLIRELNPQNSSNYFIFLNNSQGLIYLDNTYVPQIICPNGFDTFYAMMILKRFTSNYYTYDPQNFGYNLIYYLGNQAGLSLVVFAQFFLDPLWNNTIYLWVNFNFSILTTYAPSQPYIGAFGILSFGLKIFCNKGSGIRCMPPDNNSTLTEIAILQEFKARQGQISRIPWYRMSYFNNDNQQPSRLNYNAKEQQFAKKNTLAGYNKVELDKLFYIKFPDSFEVWSHIFHADGYLKHAAIICSQKCTSFSLFEVKLFSNVTSTAAVEAYRNSAIRLSQYYNEYYLLKGLTLSKDQWLYRYQYRLISTSEAYCPILNNSFEVAVLYEIRQQTCNRSIFLKHKPTQQIFQLKTMNLYQNMSPYQPYSDYCKQPTFCRNSLVKQISDTYNKTQFFNQTQNILTGRNNTLFSLNELNLIYSLDLTNLSMPIVWIVTTAKNGIEGTLLVTTNETNGDYILLSYRESPNSFTNTTGKSSKSR